MAQNKIFVPGFKTAINKHAKISGDSLNKINSIEKNTVYKINAKVERRVNEYQLIVYNMINIDVKK